MRKSIFAAAILATATSFAFAQTGTINNGAPSMTGSTAAGDTHDSMGAGDATMTKKTSKSKMKSKHSGTTGSATAPGAVTGITGTTAAGTPGQTTSGATRPAAEAGAAGSNGR